MEKTVDTVKMYDIACTLHKHLKVWNTQIAMKYTVIIFTKQLAGRNDMLERIVLCLPTFHCYGHSALCQVPSHNNNIVI